MSVYRRRLSVDQVIDRVRERWGAAAAVHNAALVAPFARGPSLRLQVLDEFAAAQRLGTR